MVTTLAFMNAKQMLDKFNVPNVYSQFSTQHYTSHKSVNSNTSSSHLGSRGVIGMSLMTVVFFMERLSLRRRELLILVTILSLHESSLTTSG